MDKLILSTQQGLEAVRGKAKAMFGASCSVQERSRGEFLIEADSTLVDAARSGGDLDTRLGGSVRQLLED